MKTFPKLGAITVAALVAGAAQAAVVTANTTIDLTTAITGTTWSGKGHVLDSVVRVRSGDTVTINIDFLGNQQLTWNGNGTFNPWLMLTGWPNGNTPAGQDGSFAWSSLSVNLLDLSEGSQFGANRLGGGSSCCIHLGPTGSLAGDNIRRTFTGATLSFVATWTDGDAWRDFGTLGYWTPLFGGTVAASTFTPPSQVPEPGSFALAGAALLLAGAARRRKAG